MAQGDLTTLDAVRAWLNLSAGATADDALLARLITATSDLIATWLNRPIVMQDYTEIRDGTGGISLRFGMVPVVSVTRVEIDGQPIWPSPDGLRRGYMFSPTRFWLIGGRLPHRIGAVRLEYRAGYDTIPPAIEQACLALVALRYRERDRVGMKSRGLARESTSYDLKAMPEDVAMLLEQYRKRVPV